MRAGYKNVHIVEEQREPNGDFPTVKSPNPEEPEALKMALELAEKTNADIDESKKIKTKAENNKGIFIKINNFLLVNLSIKKPEPSKVINDKIE